LCDEQGIGTVACFFGEIKKNYNNNVLMGEKITMESSDDDGRVVYLVI